MAYPGGEIFENFRILSSERVRDFQQGNARSLDPAFLPKNLPPRTTASKHTLRRSPRDRFHGGVFNGNRALVGGNTLPEP